MVNSVYVFRYKEQLVLYNEKKDDKYLLLPYNTIYKVKECV